MTRRGTDWAVEPSRFAGWPRAAAALAIGVTIALAALAVGLSDGVDAGIDPDRYRGAVEAAGYGAFYAALAASGQADGTIHPLAFASPALAAVAAALPPRALAALLFVLIGGVFMAWTPVVRGLLSRPADKLGVALLALGLVPFLRLTADGPVEGWAELLGGLRLAAIHLPEAWAGLLVALSLGCWARGAWVEAAAFGLAAAVVREVAGVYLGVMLVFALHADARREAAVWALAIAALAAVVAFHWAALSGELGPMAGSAPRDTNGLGVFVRALSEMVAVGPFPLAVAVAVAAVALFGWIASGAPVGARLAATVAGVGGLYAVTPGADPAWAYLVAAPLLTGLAFAPDGVRDLWRAMRGERRRITVKRVVR